MLQGIDSFMLISGYILWIYVAFMIFLASLYNGSIMEKFFSWFLSMLVIIIVIIILARPLLPLYILIN